MNPSEIASAVYRLCAETVAREMESARLSVERLRAAGLSTTPEEAAIDRLTRIHMKFQILATEATQL